MDSYQGLIRSNEGRMGGSHPHTVGAGAHNMPRHISTGVESRAGGVTGELKAPVWYLPCTDEFCD